LSRCPICWLLWAIESSFVGFKDLLGRLKTS
jgi:hypothetical protein